jgi:hypothetical protein
LPGSRVGANTNESLYEFVLLGDTSTVDESLKDRKKKQALAKRHPAWSVGRQAWGFGKHLDVFVVWYDPWYKPKISKREP